MRVKLKSGRDQRKFIERVEELSGENVFACYQCGRCSAGCPMAPEMDLLPNQIIRMVQMGLDEEVLHTRVPAFSKAGATHPYDRHFIFYAFHTKTPYALYSIGLAFQK
jgi:Fe-S oxidoreductase